MLLSGDGGNSPFAHLDADGPSHGQLEGRVRGGSTVKIDSPLLDQAPRVALAGGQLRFH